MALDLTKAARQHLVELRIATCPKRVRAYVDGHPVADTVDALLVWEPRRVTPEYAIPAHDIHLDLTEAPSRPPTEHTPPAGRLPPVLGPSRFTRHTTDGVGLRARFGERDLGEVAFRPADPELGGRIALSFQAFDWVEEEEHVISHPHDPFSRIDILRSSRHVRVEFEGVVLADSRRPVALYETGLPTRWYLPRDDVRLDLMHASDSHTTCAYKGVASYLSADGANGGDLAWFYPHPLHEATRIKDLIAFWSERTVLTVDGQRAGERLGEHPAASS